MPARPAWPTLLRRYWVFPAVIFWKLVLIGGWQLPVPANDAYFFDGAVIHWLLHGGYYNPSITGLFPTSGTALFSAYPPGYQIMLAAWMSLFGPTLAGSLWLHGFLFSVFALLILHLLHREGVSPVAANWAGAFLLVLTFHDRPDSLAHVLGLAGLILWTRPAEGGTARWGGAVLIAATLLTSIHIGAMYAAMTWGWAALGAPMRRWPWPAMLTMGALPAATVTLIVWIWPAALNGFMENVRVTPSFTGLRLPDPADLLRVARNTTGLGLVALEVLWRVAHRQPLWSGSERLGRLFAVVFVANSVAALATLTIVSSFNVWVAAFAQVLTVGLWLAGRGNPSQPLRAAWSLALFLGSLRALAITTWGVTAAHDVSQAAAATHVRAAVHATPLRSAIMVSSCFLYALADERERDLRHTDWSGGLAARPAGRTLDWLILSQMDYHRHFALRLEELASAGQLRVVSVKDHRTLPVPEDFPLLRRLFSHLSWSPVIVQIEWAE